MTENNLVDPNTADEEALAQIPGVGEEMAKRIIEERPFTSLEDLERVNGIGPLFLKNIAPYLTLSPEQAQAESEEVDLEEETASDEEEIAAETEQTSEAEELPAETDVQAETEVTQSEDEIPGEEEPVKPEIEPPDEDDVSPADAVPTKPTPPLATRSQVFWMSCASGVLAFVFALAIILGILASVNGGLRFATPSQVRGVSNQLEGLSSQFDILVGDLEGLRTRLDNLEGLSGRVESIEATTEQLVTDVGEVSGQIEDLSQEVSELVTQVEDLEAQVVILQEQGSRFQGFFEGLRELLSNLFPGEVTK